jgi:hypothetical protein
MRCYADDGVRCGDPGTRWECSQLAGWVDAAGRAPWGEDSRQVAFLATASPGEILALAEHAAISLEGGAWEGCRTDSGGWLDDDPALAAWHETAADVMERYAAGDRALTEGVVAGATYDLACELAHLRGWCPARGWPRPPGKRCKLPDHG